MRRTLALPALALLVGGCAPVLTSGGAEVRRFEGDAVDRCTLVAVVTGTGGNGPSTADNEQRATIQIRNRVAEAGGNAYAITGREVTPVGTRVKADALRCPYWQPVPCLAPSDGAAPCRPSKRAR